MFPDDEELNGLILVAWRYSRYDLNEGIGYSDFLKLTVLNVFLDRKKF
jgi:hypothetical protein